MRAVCDTQTDTLTVTFNDSPVDESDEEQPGVILDYDKEGNVANLEIPDASKRVKNPRSFEYAVAACPARRKSGAGFNRTVTMK